MDKFPLTSGEIPLTSEEIPLTSGEIPLYGESLWKFFSNLK